MSAMQDLVVRLAAQTGDFDSKMRGAMTMTNRFRGAVGGLGRSLMGFGGIASAVSVTGIAYMVKRNLDLMDSTYELSQRLGTTTDKLQGLRHASQLNGASAEILDSAMAKMVKNLGDAALGGGEAAKALVRLGLPVKDLLGMSADEQFYEIAERIKGLGSEADRASVTTDIFGRSAMSLINTLQLGKSGLAEMQSEAERLGIAFTNEAAAKADQANDAITRFSAMLKGSAIGIVAEFADEIETAAEGLGTLPEKIRAFQVGALGLARPGRGEGSLFNRYAQTGVLGLGVETWGAYQDWRTGGEYSRQLGIERQHLAKGGPADAALQAKRRAVAQRIKREAEQQAVEQKNRVRGAMGTIIGGPAATSFGWLNEMLGRAQAGVHGAVGIAHERQKMFERGREIEEQVETPMETFDRKMKELEELRSVIAPERFERALQQYEEERDRHAAEAEEVGRPGGERRGDRFAGALERNTREAYSAILAAMGRGDPQKKIEDNTKRAADGIERVAGGIERIERKGADVVPIPA